MLKVKDLPLPSWEYTAFRVKVSQLALLRDRGFDLGPEIELLNDERTLADRFSFFKELFEPLKSLKDLSKILYTRNSDGIELETYFMEPGELDPLLKAIMKKRSARPGERPTKYLMCITTQPAEYSTALSGVELELLNYYQLSVDVRSHYYAPSQVKILTEVEKKTLLDSPQMKGMGITLVNRYDPMALFYGLEVGDVIQILREGIYYGQKLMSIGYRQVV